MERLVGLDPPLIMPDCDRGSGLGKSPLRNSMLNWLAKVEHLVKTNGVDNFTASDITRSRTAP
eukprot:5970357-Lingulodinium_polyedra.AAC.1